MKKIIAGLLSFAVLLGSAVTASAVEVTEQEVSVPDFTRVNSVITVPNNVIRVYTYGVTSTNNDGGCEFSDVAYNKNYSVWFKECTSSYKEFKLKSDSRIKRYARLPGSGSGDGGKYSFNKTGGEYEKLRIKLSEYSSYFNSDGTHYANSLGEDFVANFTNQTGTLNGRTITNSNLIIISGGVYTGVVPDKEGCVEIYVSKKIGVKTEFVTHLNRGDSTTGITLYGLTMGDVEAIGGVDLSDAVLLQKHLAGAAKLERVQKRNADVNFDNNITLEDAVILQKYLADINL